jgi:hypothetical protein
VVRITPEDGEQVTKVLEVVCREKGADSAETESLLRVSGVIHDVWELRGTKDPHGRGPRSAALREAGLAEGVVDHPVPAFHLAKMLLSMPEEDCRVAYVFGLLQQYAFFCFISAEEEMRLAQAGIAETMPTSWNGIDRYARYAEVGISMGEARRFNREELRELLSQAPAPFYVYRLRTPTDKVFYIGKGEKFRALSHEAEVFSRHYRTHTNWKKLNKIAQIMYSGKELRYEIESWHIEEAQACLREDELIVMGERENPWILTNSNGRRWAGTPSRQLCELRKRCGLDT